MLGATGWVFGGALVDAAVGASPPAAGGPARCGETDVISALGDPDLRQPRVVAAHVDFGPAILFRTPDAVLASPYHRNTGMFAVHEALNAVDPGISRQILEAHGADLVVVYPGHDESFFSAEDRGKPTLFGRLVAGTPPPG